MELLRRRERPQTAGSTSFGTSAEAAVTTTAMIISGPYSQSLPVSGLSVGQIRQRLGTRLDIDPRAIAVIDGQDVSDEVVVRANSTLVFVSRAGEKG